MIKRPYYSFRNIIDEGKVAPVVAVIENLDRLVVDNGIGKERKRAISGLPQGP